MAKEERRELKAVKGGRVRFPQDEWNQYSEQYRGLRTRLNFAFSNERHKIILITSAIASEGKTTTARNLARSLSMISQKVLLIDCDMRRPTFHKTFGIKNSPGLSDILPTGELRADKILLTNVKGLEILPSGSRTSEPAEIIESEQAGTFFEKARLFYDYVVLDAPPILPVTDAVLLGNYADGVLMVTEFGKTPREIVQEALVEIQNAHIIGLVMNKIPATRQYYSYYGYY